MGILEGKVRVSGAGFVGEDVLRRYPSAALVKFLGLLLGGRLSLPEVNFLRFEGPAFSGTGDPGVLAMLDSGERDGERAFFDAYMDAVPGCEVLVEA